jgi:hypothetical protein
MSEHDEKDAEAAVLPSREVMSLLSPGSTAVAPAASSAATRSSGLGGAGPAPATADGADPAPRSSVDGAAVSKARALNRFRPGRSQSAYPEPILSAPRFFIAAIGSRLRRFVASSTASS